MSPSLSRLLFSLILSCSAFLGLNRCMTGSEIPNEISGTLVNSEGQPQAGARVDLFRSDLVPSDSAKAEPVASITSDAKGQYTFRSLPAGIYNVLAAKEGVRAFQDSLQVLTDGRIHAGTDTLKAPGTLTGHIQLEPQDNPRLALIQVIGTDIFVNVDSAGAFRLTDMAEGKYRIRIFVTNNAYVPEFRVVAIRSGRDDTLPEVIAPYYIGPARISGLQAQALPNGVIRISWNRSKSPDPFMYALFREDRDVPFMSGNALNYFITDTVYLDTIYSRTPRPDPFGFQTNSGVYAGQYPWEDTTAYAFRYRLMISTSDGQVSNASEYVRVVAKPPTVP